MLSRMDRPVEFFAYWTSQYAVTVVPPPLEAEGPRLRFTPERLAPGVQTPVRDLFSGWFRTSGSGQSLPTLLNLLAALTAYGAGELSSPQFQQEALTAAHKLGPLFTVLPLGTAQRGLVVEEPLALWWQAAVKLRELSEAIAVLTRASGDSSKTARKRRGNRLANEAIGPQLEELEAEEQRQQRAVYRPGPGISARHQAGQDVADLIDALWLPPMRSADAAVTYLSFPRPRLSEDGLMFQLNVPMGLQALLIMTLHDQSIGRTLHMRTCARERCRKVRFMKAGQKYCDGKCRHAVEMQRARQKVKSPKRGKPLE
jgi:hypothetical protein